MKKLFLAALITACGFSCTYAQEPTKPNKADSLLKKKYGIDTTKPLPGDTMHYPRKDSIIRQKPGEAIKTKKQGGPQNP